MANPDKARGFIPKYHLNGGSWNNALATVAMPDDAEEEADGWFIGMPVVLADESNSAEGDAATLPLVTPLTDEMDEVTDAVYGVIVGVGHPGTAGDLAGGYGPYNPQDLEQRHITAAEVEGDSDGFRLYVAPAKDWVYEAQVEAASDSLTVGQGANVAVADSEAATELGNQTTGFADAYELTATETHPQLIVVGFPESPDNDTELASANVHVVFTQAFGSQGVALAAGSAGDE